MTIQGTSRFINNITFHDIKLDALFDEGPGYEEDRRAMVRCVKEGISAGIVVPLPTTVFNDSQLEEAFR